MRNEEWKPVFEYEEFYEVSNWGRVRSLERKFTNSRGEKRTLPQKILIGYFDRKGYYRVKLTGLRKPKNFPVHRLVAIAFVPNYKKRPHVNHIDGRKINNYADNLEWVTPAENNKHALEAGLNKNPQEWKRLNGQH